LTYQVMGGRGVQLTSSTMQEIHSSIRIDRKVVLTQRSGGSKLERVDFPRKGKGSCKRSNGPLHENLSKKQYSLCDRAINRKPKSHEIEGSQTARCIIGATCLQNRVNRLFLAAVIRLHKKKKFAS